MCFSKMLIKLVSNNISTANMYFFCYSDLDFLVFGGDKFKLTNIFALAEDLRIAFQIPVDVFEISEINTDSEFYSVIMNERLNVA